MIEKRVCVLTGANAGIGKATAVAIVKDGAHVVMVCRNKEKAEEARREICGSAQVEPDIATSLVLADLSRPDQIRRAAREIAARFPQVHVLVNNAGAIFARRELTAEGFEKTFATNHLNYFLLSHYLLPQLREAARVSGECSRIVNVASDAHRQIKSPDRDWQSEGKYSGFRAYGLSKLANILFTQEWARRYGSERIVINALHPGVIRTDIGTRPGGVIGLIWGLMKPFMATAERGARTSVFLAQDPQAVQNTGAYFASCQASSPSRVASDAGYAADLWEYTERILAPWMPVPSGASTDC